MKNDLDVINLYRNTDESRVDQFSSNVHSDFSLEANNEKTEVNFEWLDIMEESIRYIDNILRNPNRFIVNEEEIVNVEQARRITVESIKHLARHTNYIQKIEENGDVKPSKILNINKDESFNTYENRVIFTLIQNMEDYISFKKAKLITNSSAKDSKRCEYNAMSHIGAESVNISLSLDSKMSSSDNDGAKDGMSVPERIAKLEMHIRDLKNSEVYKNLAKMHVAKVIPPIKKTNLILKNTNFQYAMKLWNYLQSHMDDDTKKTKDNKVYNAEVDPKLKRMLDDVFLLNYLVVNSVSANKNLTKEEKNKEVVEQLTNSMITRIVELNSDLPIAKLQEIIGDKIAVIKNKKEASIVEVQKIFDSRMQKYINRIGDFKF
jgi:Rps23 Pro-64 3,4-dihydroxylase Tpa1-like proline 4-hydroxylase